MPDVELRPETPADATAIAVLVEAAFGASAEAKLVEALRVAGYYGSLGLETAAPLGWRCS